jgi:TonB family protein
VVSFDFAVSLLPGWHATIFPPYFVAGAIYSGFAMVLTLLIPMRSIYGLQDMITLRHLDNMAKITLVTGLIVFYGYMMEAFFSWYSANEFEQYVVLNRALGPYAWSYYALLLCNCTLPQALSSPMYSEAPGSGQVGTTANTTLGSRFAGYAAQIRTLVAQQWRTSGIDQRLQNPPQVIVTFELMRNGTIRNLRLLQKSGNSALDLSVLRAIEDAAAPFPPIPPGFEKDYAKVEFTFELKR